MEIPKISPLFNSQTTAEKSISLEKAVEIFDQLADRTDIAFGYLYDGCYARTHLACKSLLEMGLTPQKAWAFEDLDRLLIKNPEGQIFSSWYHVAPALSVLMPDGQVEDLVFDPSLFDGPVSLTQWADIMQAPHHCLQIIPLGVAPEGYAGDYRPRFNTFAVEASLVDAHAQKVMKGHLQFQGDEIRSVFASHIRRQMPQQQGIQARGATWISAESKPAASASSYLGEDNANNGI